MARLLLAMCHAPPRFAVIRRASKREPCSPPLWRGRPSGRPQGWSEDQPLHAGLGATPQLVADEDGLGDLLLGLAALAALALDGEIRLFFRDAQVALQDALRALDDFPLLEPLRELAVLGLEPRHL